MRTWKDLEQDFRALLEYRQDAFLEHWPAAVDDDERWNVSGPSPEQIHRFESLSMMAGAKVLDLPASAEWPSVLDERDAKTRWYRCLTHFSPNYKPHAMVIRSHTADGQTPPERLIGKLGQVFAESSRLCLRMEAFTVAPRRCLEALAVAPRYAGAWQHWRASQDSLAAAEPNLPKAVADAVHAVEGLARLVINDPKATLGEAVKELRTKRGLNGALSNSIDRVFGYASDEAGIRHGASTPVNVKPEEARFAIDVCEAALLLLLALDIP